MKEELVKLFKGVHYRLHALKDGMVTSAEVHEHLVEDYGDMLTEIYVSIVAKGEVVKMDAMLEHQGHRIPITFLTQNHNTNSLYAQMAKQGITITWVLHKDNWRGYIQDGVYHQTKEKKSNLSKYIDKKDREAKTMMEYITKLAKELPNIPKDQVATFVGMANKLGMIKC